MTDKISLLLFLSVFSAGYGLDTTMQVYTLKTKQGEILDKSSRTDLSNQGVVQTSLDSNHLTGSYFKSMYHYSGSNLIRYEAKPNGILSHLFTKEYGYDASGNITKIVARKQNGDTNFLLSTFYQYPNGIPEESRRDSAGNLIRMEKIVADSCRNVVGKTYWYQTGVDTTLERKFFYNNSCGDTSVILAYSLQTPGLLVGKSVFSNHKLVTTSIYTNSDTSTLKQITAFTYPSSGTTVAISSEYGASGQLLNSTKQTSTTTSNGLFLSKVVRDNNGGAQHGRVLGAAKWSYDGSDSLLAYSKFELDSIENCSVRIRNQRGEGSRLVSSVSFDENCDTVSIATFSYSP